MTVTIIKSMISTVTDESMSMQERFESHS